MRLCRVPLLFPRWCVHMGASVSHSSPSNWHLTAASHGLLRRLRFRPPLLSFPSAWEAAAGTFSCTLYAPPKDPQSHPSSSSPRSDPARGFAPQTALSAHYRGFLRQPVAPKSNHPTPLCVAHLHLFEPHPSHPTPPPPLLPLPPALH